MKTDIQNTELYQSFKKALGINDLRVDDNPYIVECCKIAEDYAKLRLSAVMPSLPIERFDAEDWLGQNKDIWNHPRVTDRNNKESYEVADLMAEFAMSFFRQ